jgi:hypothetical protein
MVMGFYLGHHAGLEEMPQTGSLLVLHLIYVGIHPS